MNQIAIISSLSKIIETLIEESILKKAVERNVLKLKTFNLREYGLGKKKQIDDSPFGGGGGMVLMPEPLFNAIEDAISWMQNKDRIRVILPSPSGKKWDQVFAEKFSKKKALY